MRLWPARAVLAAVLVGSLAVRERTPDLLATNTSLEPAVLRLARSRGLTFREYLTIADTGRRALVFDVPGCSEPLRVIVRSITFEEEPFTQLPRARSYAERYVYIEQKWKRPHRLAVWVERIKYEVLATFGLTQYVPNWQLLQVQLPPDCDIADAIDWRMVWNRTYLNAAGAGTTAVSG